MAFPFKYDKKLAFFSCQNLANLIRKRKNNKKSEQMRSVKKPPKSAMFGIRLPRRAVLSRRRPARTWESEGPFPQLRALREEDFFFELSTFTEVFHYALLLGSPPLAAAAALATRDKFQEPGNFQTLLRKCKHCLLHGAPRENNKISFCYFQK